MNNASIAPCGVICDICLGFQRNKNKCVGCNNTGNKPNHCSVCSMKLCPEKMSDEKLLCYDCVKFPCKRMKEFDKRYRLKYGESPIQNLITIKEIGISKFIDIEREKWKCSNCGQLLCVHKEDCLYCGSINVNFPRIKT